MNTTQLIETVAKKHKITKVVAKDVVNTVFGTITGEVKKGKKVSLVGFGTFERIKRKARTCRNPQTGETIKVKATKAPKFRAGKAFKTLVK